MIAVDFRYAKPWENSGDPSWVVTSKLEDPSATERALGMGGEEEGGGDLQKGDRRGG